MNLSSNCLLTKVQDITTAGTSAVNSDSVDMLGYEGAWFFLSYGTAAADNTLNAAQSADDSAFADLLGSMVTPDATTEDLWIDVYKPTDRYVRCELVRGTSTTVGDIWCIQYKSRKAVVDNNTTGTIEGELNVGGVEGTA